jgi:hypothetical protein
MSLPPDNNDSNSDLSNDSSNHQETRHINEMTGSSEFEDTTSSYNSSKSKSGFVTRFGHQETRHKIATFLLGQLFFLEVLIAGHLFIPIFVNTKKISPDNKELITLMWTSEISLLGTVLGFYFSIAINENQVRREKNKGD